MTSLLQDASTTVTPLESQARSILGSSIHSIPSITSSSSSSPIYYYPRAYNSFDFDGVVDSTTLLIAARTLSKLGRSDLSWEFLRTLFCAQSPSGFLPRFVYLNHTTTKDTKQHEFEGAAWSNFIGVYPGPKLFGNKSPEEYDIQPSLDNNETKVWSSNTIMATPHHATSILEIFYLSNQTAEDVDSLSIFYSKLQLWHTYLHQQIISNCSDVTNANEFPCLVLKHPLETEIDMKSPLWETSLMNVTKIIKEKKWNSGISIPRQVKDSFDYPGDDMYNSYLYLLQCLNEGKNSNSTLQNNNTNYYSRCPFGMLDVGFSAALAKADIDMLMIGQILADKNHLTRPTTDEMASTKARRNRSMNMLNALWHKDRGSFFNRLVMLTETNDGWYSTNSTMPVEASIAYNFFSMIDPMLNSSLVAEMSMQLLERSGKLSFDCGDYPLWAVGGCSDSSPIIPLVNYRVSTGLIRNGELGLGDYISNGLFNLICGLPNSAESNLMNCRENVDFANAFNGTSALPMGKNVLQSSLTAAVVLDLLLPDKEFSYEGEPPISSSSVIFLIAAELVVAFAVGVVCLVLSLNLMRRANADEEGDEFVQLVNEQQPLYEEEQEDGCEDAVNTSSIGAWSLELISYLSPMKWFSRESVNNS